MASTPPKRIPQFASGCLTLLLLIAATGATIAFLVWVARFIHGG